MLPPLSSSLEPPLFPHPTMSMHSLAPGDASMTMQRDGEGGLGAAVPHVLQPPAQGRRGRMLTRRKESSAQFSMNSVMIMTGRLLVTTPSRWMMLGWSNWPMMLASLRKSRRCRSV